MSLPLVVDDEEAIESWNQLNEFDNRVTHQKEPNFKYPKIEYNRQFNAKTSNQPVRERKSIT
jgi:hypothetical protein